MVFCVPRPSAHCRFRSDSTKTRSAPAMSEYGERGRSAGCTVGDEHGLGVAVPQRRALLAARPPRCRSTTSGARTSPNLPVYAKARHRPPSRKTALARRRRRTSSTAGCTPGSRRRQGPPEQEARRVEGGGSPCRSAAGYAISSRKPPMCGALKNSVVSVPIAPSSPTSAPGRTVGGSSAVTGSPMNSSPLTSGRGRPATGAGQGVGDRLLAEDGQPGNNAAVVTGWWATGTVTLTMAWARWRRRRGRVEADRKVRPAQVGADAGPRPGRGRRCRRGRSRARR